MQHLPKTSPSCVYPQQQPLQVRYPLYPYADPAPTRGPSVLVLEGTQPVRARVQVHRWASVGVPVTITIPAEGSEDIPKPAESFKLQAILDVQKDEYNAIKIC